MVQRVNSSDGTQNPSLWAAEWTAPSQQRKGHTFPGKPLHLTQNCRKLSECWWTGIYHLCFNTFICIITTKPNHQQNHIFTEWKHVMRNYVNTRWKLQKKYEATVKCYNHYKLYSINLLSINLFSTNTIEVVGFHCKISFVKFSEILLFVCNQLLQDKPKNSSPIWNLAKSVI